MNNGEWLEEVVSWLEGYEWQWFATLTFRHELSPAQARWRLLRWADELQQALGTDDFEWIGVPERGSTGLHFHYHVLIAGLDRGCGAAERLYWMQRWFRFAGDARIEEFRANCGGVRYVLKHVGPNDFDSIELHLISRRPVAKEAGTK
jgi:hypothetical protein